MLYWSSWCTKHLRMSYGNVYCEGLEVFVANNAENRVWNCHAKACIVAYVTIVALPCIVTCMTG